eukprot:128781_1
MSHLRSPTGNELVEAAKLGDFDKVKQFIEAGIPINSLQGGTWTALLIACMSGYLKIVEYLLQCDPSPDLEVRSWCQYTPLLEAAKWGHDLIVAALIECGADIEVTNAAGLTPLCCAAANGHLLVVQLLLEKGSYISGFSKTAPTWNQMWRSKDNRSPNVLEIAIDSGQKEIVRWLLLSDYFINMEDWDRAKMTKRATKAKHGQIIRIIQVCSSDGINQTIRASPRIQLLPEKVVDLIVFFTLGANSTSEEIEGTADGTKSDSENDWSQTEGASTELDEFAGVAARHGEGPLLNTLD